MRLEVPIYIDIGLIIVLLLSIVLNLVLLWRTRARRTPGAQRAKFNAQRHSRETAEAEVQTLRQDLEAKERGTRGKRERLAREEPDAEFERLRGELRKQTAAALGRVRDEIAAAKRASSEAERRARKEGEAGFTALQSKVKAELERLQHQLGAVKEAKGAAESELAPLPTELASTEEPKGVAESELARGRTELADGSRRAEDGAVGAAPSRQPGDGRRAPHRTADEDKRLRSKAATTDELRIEREEFEYKREAEPKSRKEAARELERLRGKLASAGATTFLLVSTSVVLATWTATSADSRLALVLPLAAAAGLVLGVLALTRFTTYVQVLLVARASLDLAQVSGEAAERDLSARALDPSSLFAGLFLVTVALWLSAQHRSRGRLPGSPLRRALCMFVAAALLSIVGTSNYGASSHELVRILAAVMMFVVLEQVMLEPTNMRKMLRAVYLSAVFPLAFTLVDVFSGSPRSEVKGSFVRLLGPFNQSNNFARYLMLLIVFGAAIYPRVDRTSRRILALLLGVSSVFLVLTYTRSALVATFLGLAVVGLLQEKRLLMGLLIAVALLVVVNPTFQARFTELGGSDSVLAVNTQNTLQWRFEQWAQILELSRANPITGTGLATTQRLTENEKQPHNDFVRTYVETGIIGFLTYVGVLVALLRVGWRAVKAAPAASFEQSVGVGFLGCGVAFIAVSVVANVISNVVILWYFLSFGAAASAVVLRNVESSEHQRAPARASIRGAVI